MIPISAIVIVFQYDTFPDDEISPTNMVIDLRYRFHDLFHVRLN